MFIEKIVFEKSYSAQLHRSRAGARVVVTISPAPARPTSAGSACVTKSSKMKSRRRHKRGYKLSPMFESRPQKITLLFIAVAALTSSCKADKQSASADTSNVASTSTSTAASEPSTNGWNENEAGPVLLLSMSEAIRQASV